MTKFIAEISSNHGRSLERCEALIKAAAEAGCWAVKFQLFKIDKLFAPKVLALSQMHRDRRQWELPLEFVPELLKLCRKYGVAFGCTPFYLEAVDEIEPYVDFYKVASYELIWLDLLKAVAKKGKPTVISTGMATMPEVIEAASFFKGIDLTILHCVSSYPTPPAEANLKAIETIRTETGYPTGWSDHSVDPAVIYRAVHRWQASMVEFHIDLDRTGFEAHIGHCWYPDQIRPVIATITTGLTSDGDGIKQPVPSELPDRPWRRDPVDGLRPIREIREAWNG